MPSNPTLGAGLPETLAAGAAGKWFDARPYVGHKLPVTIEIAGGATALIEGSPDPTASQTKSLVQTIGEQMDVSIAKVIDTPLPSFVRVRNNGGAGTVKYAFHVVDGRQIAPQTIDSPVSGAFSA